MHTTSTRSAAATTSAPAGSAASTAVAHAELPRQKNCCVTASRCHSSTDAFPSAPATALPPRSSTRSCSPGNPSPACTSRRPACPSRAPSWNAAPTLTLKPAVCTRSSGPPKYSTVTSSA